MALLAPLGLRELTLCAGEMPPDARVMWHQQEKIILGEIRTQNRSLETKTICSMKQAQFETCEDQQITIGVSLKLAL